MKVKLLNVPVTNRDVNVTDVHVTLDTIDSKLQMPSG